MNRRCLTALGRQAYSTLVYGIPALSLAWFAGGQMALDRIDAMLAIPWLMPGALLLAWLVRDRAAMERCRAAAMALAGLLAAQLLLHILLGGRIGGGPLALALVAGLIALLLADVMVQRLCRRRAWLCWLLVPVAALSWFTAGRVAVAWLDEGCLATPRPDLAILTGLPLRWGGGRNDIAAMLASGPADAPALGELARRFDVRLIDSVGENRDDEALLVAHPRALAPADLVALDRRVRRGAPVVVLADALSTWPPPHPLGDSRNPPVTSLLTPLFDHWGVALMAPEEGQGDDAALFVDPAGRKLLLHSAGRFSRLPGGCQSWGGGRVARCRIGGERSGTIWLVGDADMLHDSLWRAPSLLAPTSRRSDNVAWLADLLASRSPSPLRPIWIR